jgi:membrane protease subunit HflC
MNRNLMLAGAIIVGLIGFVAWNSVFVVEQWRQALVLQLGDPIRIEREPGLKWKLPFLQQVIFFDRRLLDFDADAQEVIMADQKRLVVDAFARYRIVDPLRFFQTVGTEANMRNRLSAIVVASLRNVLGSVPFVQVLSARRAELMRQISDAVVVEAKSFGVKVIDVRIMRADLHPDNSPAIYARMQTERQREANLERAEGAEMSQTIRAEAERDRTVLLANANREANILRGKGDADATKTFADAFNRDPSFYAFYRSLQAYQRALGDGNSTMVLSPDSDFFRYFHDLQGAPSERSKGPAKK